MVSKRPVRPALEEIGEQVPSEGESATTEAILEEGELEKGATALYGDVKRLQQEVDRLDAENKDLKQNIALRKRYAEVALAFWMLWLFFVLFIVAIAGFGRILSWEFQLPETVLLALVATLTANVIGLVVVVARYLFPRQHKVPSSSQ